MVALSFLNSLCGTEVSVAGNRRFQWLCHRENFSSTAIFLATLVRLVLKVIQLLSLSAVMFLLDSGASLPRLKVPLSVSFRICYTLQSFVMVLSHPKVKWFSDSLNVCRNASAGSSKSELQSIEVHIFRRLICL